MSDETPAVYERVLRLHWGERGLEGMRADSLRISMVPTIAEAVVMLDSETQELSREKLRERLRFWKAQPLYYLTADAVAAFVALRDTAPHELPDAHDEARIVVIAGAPTIDGFSIYGYRTAGKASLASHFEAAGPGAVDHAAMRLFDWIIDNPDLMERKPVKIGKPPSKAAKRRGKVRDDRTTVTVIDLRAAPKRQLDAVSEAERTYRHRWIVRGHWHTYKVGPGRSESRVKYVMPYVKGPDGAPMIESVGTVNRW